MQVHTQRTWSNSALEQLSERLREELSEQLLHAKLPVSFDPPLVGGSKKCCDLNIVGFFLLRPADCGAAIVKFLYWGCVDVVWGGCFAKT